MGVCVPKRHSAQCQSCFALYGRALFVCLSSVKVPWVMWPVGLNVAGLQGSREVGVFTAAHSVSEVRSGSTRYSNRTASRMRCLRRRAGRPMSTIRCTHASLALSWVPMEVQRTSSARAPPEVSAMLCHSMHVMRGLLHRQRGAPAALHGQHHAPVLHGPHHAQGGRNLESLAASCCQSPRRGLLPRCMLRSHVC